MTDERFLNLLEAAQSRRMNRRDVLKRATALGLSAPLIAGLLAACGGDDDDADPTNTTGTTDEATATSGSGVGTPTFNLSYGLASAQITNSGKSAIFGIGNRAATSGTSPARARLNRPISTPRPMPTLAPSEAPISRRFIEGIR